MTELADIKQVPLRQAWPHEAQDFTPWLAKAENLDRIGRSIGVELALKGTEVAVGPYSADILAENEGGLIVIENQLEKTNHDHLGKALTYAAVLGATTIVWVAQHFTDEHKKALDWLNDHSTEEVGFFGVQVELWSIDGSRPAVRFNVVSRPAGIVRQASASKASAELSEVKKQQLKWWQLVSERLLSNGVLTSVREPKPRYWYDVAIGRTGIFISCIANSGAQRVGVRLYMKGSRGGAAALEQLLQQKSEIESEVGYALQWDASPDANDKTIATHHNLQFDKPETWDEPLNWMVKQIEKFRDVFGPRIRALDLDPPADLDDED